MCLRTHVPLGVRDRLELQLQSLGLELGLLTTTTTTTPLFFLSQMRLREAEMEKERAMEEERLREEEKKKTDIQVEAEAGRRLQQEALKPLFDSDSNHERIWHQQEDFESDADSQTSMDIGGKAEWSARSGMGSSWFTRQASVRWCSSK